ncbi:MAG: dihydroneopterin aldolase [Sphingomonas bacterium]|nr:dihydroneopterin aldolase [Sphingomonas bacterium]
MTEPRYALILDGLSLTMGLGIHAHEQMPQRVLVDVRLDCRYPAAPAADHIAEALDYDTIYRGIVTLAASRHFNLQETLCDEIASLCLADPRVERVTVRSCKPDIFPDARVGCEIVRGR